MRINRPGTAQGSRLFSKERIGTANFSRIESEEKVTLRRPRKKFLKEPQNFPKEAAAAEVRKSTRDRRWCNDQLHIFLVVTY
jgi:hypothetical protein